MKKIVPTLLALLLALVFLFPLAVILLHSLSKNQFVFSAYADVLFGNRVYLKQFWYTLLMAFLSAGTQCFASLLSAFIFTHPRFKKSRWLRFVFIFFFLLPFQATALPHYQFAQQYGLYDNMLALVVILGFAPLGVCLLSGFIISLPSELFDAALLDTTNPLRILTSLVLPHIASAVRALFIISFSYALSSVDLPLVVMKTESRLPLSTFIADMPAAYSTQHFAACILYALPVILLYTLFAGDVLNGLSAIGRNGEFIK